MNKILFQLVGSPLVVLLLACSDTTSPTPHPRAGLLELRITGDFSVYQTANLHFNDSVGGLTRTDSTLTGNLGMVPFGEVTLALDLLRPPEVQSGGQINTKFDVVDGSFMFGGSRLEVDLSDFRAPVQMLSLTNGTATAVLIDDPCVLETRVLTSSMSVDVDRALYGATFSELIAFLFVQTAAYGGENVFDFATDSQQFDATCQGGEWQLADTLVCVTDNSINCLYYAWGDSTPTALRRTGLGMGP